MTYVSRYDEMTVKINLILNRKQSHCHEANVTFFRDILSQNMMDFEELFWGFPT